LSKILVTRVSSQAITFADFKVSIARSVMSPRLPIGVATTYNAFSSECSISEVTNFSLFSRDANTFYAY
jgi:hypothetical protein